MTARVLSVAHHGAHEFSKPLAREIRLIEAMGVDGDAHCGATVRHRSRVRTDPTQPNLRQVHLIHAELLDELRAKGFRVEPGDLGENILTEGIDLLGLPSGAVLQLGAEAEIEVTGLRNPCRQIEAFQTGLLSAVLDRADDGSLIRKTGVMAIVRQGGVVRPGDPIAITLPSGPHQPLQPV